VDKKLQGQITELEWFQLERMDDRLEAEDDDPAQEARDREWDEKGRELIDSIEELLIKLRQ
jgi:hypothetical protein